MNKGEKSRDVKLCGTEETSSASNTKISRDLNRHQLENLLDSLPIITYMVEPRPPYTPIYVSRNINILGYTQKDWYQTGGLWITLIHEDDRERILAETKAAIHSGGETDYEYRMRARDGKVFWFYDKGLLPATNKATRLVGKVFCLTLQSGKRRKTRSSKAKTNIVS